MRKKLKIPPFSDIDRLGPTKALGHLPAPVIKQVMDQYEESRKDRLRPKDLPITPSAFAQKYSGGLWVSAPHLELISTKLVKTATSQGRLMVSMPPRHGKSLLIDVWFPLFILAHNPSAKIMLAAYEASFAADWGMKVRDKVLELGPQLGLQLNPDKAARDNWELTSGGGMSTAGAGGPMTGKGANVLIVDDPIKDEEQASSKVYRDKIYNWWQQVAFTRIEPGGCVVIVGTRWHQDDLLGRLEAESASGEGLLWDILKLPAEAEKDDALGREVGQWLWEARFPVQKYEDMKKGVSPYAWSALYQQRPTPESGGGIQRTWWKFYQPHQLPTQFDQIIQSWDLALKDKTSSDYNVGQVWGRRGADFFLLGQFRERCDIVKVIYYAKEFAKKYPKGLAKLVEEQASGPALIQSLRHSIPGFIGIKTPARASKEARLKAVAPAIEAGGVFLPENSDGTKPHWVWEYIEEFAQFPKGVNDDQVDATTQALTYMLPGGRASFSRDFREALSEEGPKTTEELLKARVGALTKRLKIQGGERVNRENGADTTLGDIAMGDDWNNLC